MLFNSPVFIFAFLPITLIVYYLLGRSRPAFAQLWLIGASLFFYGWWNPAYLALICGLLVINYGAGRALHNTRSKTLLTAGIAFNLAVLGYFKYANFFVDTINHALDTGFVLEKIILPLAISFFTFQKIAYLVDSYKGRTVGYNFREYCLFVTFFPQLIAGPIVHHSDIIPQLRQEAAGRLDIRKAAIGMTLFIIGLSKKMILADTLSQFADPAFTAVHDGIRLTFMEAWTAILAFTFQIYFDFSGYSDMAMGLGFLFGIILPVNFLSPYKSANLIEFWRRWHISLSRFLRNYLYIPLGGNRHGKIRQGVSIMITMILGGLWHGAQWTFVAWGALHGLLLVLSHISGGLKTGRAGTFLIVCAGWVLFRASGMGNALSVYASMAGLNGGPLTGFAHGLYEEPFWNFQIINIAALGLLALCTAIVMTAPNSVEIIAGNDRRFLLPGDRDMAGYAQPRLTWTPSRIWACLMGVAAFACMAHSFRTSEFIYFQF